MNDFAPRLSAPGLGLGLNLLGRDRVPGGCGVEPDLDLPRSDDLPSFETVLVELPSKANPLGVKGSRQAGRMAAPQTVMAAILDALAPLGVRELDMPATSEEIWRAIRGSAPGLRSGALPPTPKLGP